MSLWRLLHDLRVPLWPLWLSIAFTIVMTAAGLGLLALSGWFITAASVAGLAALAGAFSFNLLIPSSLIRALALGRTGFRYAERLLSHDATLRLVVKLRRFVFDGLYRELGHHGGREQDALDRLMSDASVVEGALLRTLLPLLGSVVAALFTPVLALVIAPAAVLPTLLPLLTLIAVIRVRGPGYVLLAREIDRESRHARERAIALADGRYELGLLLSATEQQALIDQAYAGLTTARLAKVDREQRDRWILGISQAMALLGLLALPLELPIMVGLLLALLATGELLVPALGVYFERERVRLAMARMPTASEFVSQESSDRLILDQLAVAPDTNLPPLNAPLSLDLHAGDAAVIQGPSGVGKTTLLRTLAGLIPPAGGRLDRPQTVGLVMQHPWLPDDQLRTVLSLGLTTQPSDAALWSALETVELADWANALSDGLETWIGAEGVLPSGGQQRRIAIARVLLQNPELILMDEPTEGLEPALAMRLMQRLATAFAQRIWIVVSHRPEPQSVIDRVITLHAASPETGRTAELPYTAPHDDLSHPQDLR